MDARLIESGEIVRAHGSRGEVKITPWSNEPEFLLRFDTVYIDGCPVGVRSMRVHAGAVIAGLEGVYDPQEAGRLRGKTVCIDRAQAGLREGEFFLRDLIGLRALNDDGGAELGLVADIMSLPAGDIYVVRPEEKGGGDILIPAVREFVTEINPACGYIRFRLIEGMA